MSDTFVYASGGAERRRVGTGRSVNIEGSYETLRLLGQWSPDLRKVFEKQAREALKVTKRSALGEYPTGKWSIRFNSKSLFGQIVAASRGDRGRTWGESGGGVRAAIWEFIGSRYAGDSPQVLGMIAHLNEKYGGTGRLLWDAWDRTGEQVLGQITGAFRIAESEFQSRLNAVGKA